MRCVVIKPGDNTGSDNKGGRNVSTIHRCTEAVVNLVADRKTKSWSLEVMMATKTKRQKNGVQAPTSTPPTTAAVLTSLMPQASSVNCGEGGLPITITGSFKVE